MKNQNDTKIIPVVSYTNTDIHKSIIYKENKGKSGIYRWNNLITGKSYVGSSICLSNRLFMYYNSSFINKKLSNGSSAIYSAILKYGYSNFSLDILEYCEKDVLIEREQYYIDTLNPKYNILKIAGSRTGFKHSEKTKALISINNKGENNPNLGKILTKETRKKISESLKLTLKLKVRINNKPKKVGLETRKKLSLRSRGIPVKVFDESNNLVNEFPSIRSVARHFDISYKTVGRYLNKDVNYGEYKFKSFIKDV